MKIGETQKTAKTDKAKKTGKAQQSDAAFGDFIASAPTQTASASPAQNIVAVDALLAVQSAGTATDRPAKKRMMHRAETILDGLDAIRDKMLQGTLSVGDMIGIADVVAEHRENIDDPRLTSVMDEIDLRAQVELAKMQKAIENL